MNKVFESNVLLKENSIMLRTVFWFDWNILFYFLSELYIEFTVKFRKLAPRV